MDTQSSSYKGYTSSEELLNMRHLKTVDCARFIKDKFFEIILSQFHCIHKLCFQWEINCFLRKS
jgi:hypothetical protein